MTWITAHSTLIGTLLALWIAFATYINKTIWPKPSAPKWLVVLHFVLIDLAAWAAAQYHDSKLFGFIKLPFALPFLTISAVSESTPPAPPPNQSGFIGTLLMIFVSASWIVMYATIFSGCSTTQRVATYTAAIATVETIDAGIDRYSVFLVAEEPAIASAAIKACEGVTPHATFVKCAHNYAAPHREPIDKANEAIRIYRTGLAAAQKGLSLVDLNAAATAVMKALDAFGIKVTSPPTSWRRTSMVLVVC